MIQETLYARAIEEVDVSALPVMHLKNRDYGKVTRGYAFTNENHADVLEHVSFEGKNVFGVAGSGDYLALAIGNGAINAVGADVSLISCFFTELKFAALRHLTLQEFIEFYAAGPGDHDMHPAPLPPKKDADECRALFSKNTYEEKLRPSLSPTAQSFFDGIIGKAYLTTRGRPMAYPLHYLLNRLTKEEMRQIPYLESDDQYLAVQKKLLVAKTPHLIPLDVASALGMAQEEFDTIYLSNIPQFFRNYAEAEHLLQIIDRRLAPQGRVVVYGAGKLAKEMQKRGYCVEKVESSKPAESFLRSPIMFPQAYVISR